MDADTKRRIDGILGNNCERFDEACAMPEKTDVELGDKGRMIQSAYACMFAEFKIVLMWVDAWDAKEAWAELTRILEERKAIAKAGQTKDCLEMFLNFTRLLAK